jgi:hypothetical protein
MTPKNRKIVYTCIGIVIALYIARSFIISGIQMAYYQRALQQASQQKAKSSLPLPVPVKPVVTPVIPPTEPAVSATPAPEPVAAVPPVIPAELSALDGIWRGKAALTPLFIFHEIVDQDNYALQARPVFERMAKLSAGVYTEFRPDSGAILRELLSTVAAFAAGGSEAVRQVAAPKTPEARQLRASLMLGPGDASEKR